MKIFKNYDNWISSILPKIWIVFFIAFDVFIKVENNKSNSLAKEYFRS